MSREENFEKFDELQSDITQALEAVLGKHDQSQVLKWVTILEVIDLADGERGLWIMTDATAKAWDTKGMLQHALDLQQANSIAYELQGDDD